MLFIRYCLLWELFTRMCTYWTNPFPFPFFFSFPFLFLHISFKKQRERGVLIRTKRLFGHNIPLVPFPQAVSSGVIRALLWDEERAQDCIHPLPAPGRRNNTRCFPSQVFSLLGSDKECVFLWFLWKFLSLLMVPLTLGRWNKMSGLLAQGEGQSVPKASDSWLVGHLLIFAKSFKRSLAPSSWG